MTEIATLVVGLMGTSALLVFVNNKWITTRLWRAYLWKDVPRMDVQAEEYVWELVADAALNVIDNQYLEGEICSQQRLSMLQKLRKSPGLGFQFSPRNMQLKLKEVIRERLGTHTAPKFPDPGPYALAYSSQFGDRCTPVVVTLRMRTGKWAMKRP
jgi:hypothetical protein